MDEALSKGVECRARKGDLIAVRLRVWLDDPDQSLWCLGLVTSTRNGVVRTWSAGEGHWDTRPLGHIYVIRNERVHCARAWREKQGRLWTSLEAMTEDLREYVREES